MHKPTGKKIPRLILKSLLWIILGVFSLIAIVLITIQFPKPQQYLTNKITRYLSQKLHTKVALVKISVAFPKDISLTDLYIEDLHQDTLLFAHSLKVNLNLFDLLSKKLELKDIGIEQLTAHVYREFPDTTFNYSFIVKAFTGKKEKPVQEVEKDSTKENFQFTIKNIHLKDIYLTYKDTVSGTNAAVVLGGLETGFDEFDLDKQKIHLHAIELKNTTARVAQSIPLKTDTSVSQPFAFDIGVKKIDLTRVKFTYLNAENYQDLRADLGKFLVEADKIDIGKERIALKNISLSESAIVYTLNKTITADSIAKAVTQKEPSTNERKSNWVITLDQLDLQNNSFAYDNKNTVPLTAGIDFNHLMLRGINIDGEEIHVAPDNIKLVLNDLNLKEDKGFELKKFSTRLTYDTTHIELDKLNLQTDKTKISHYLGISFKSMGSMKDSIGSLQTKINLNNTTIAVSDVLLFKPDLLNNPNLNVDPNTLIHLNCRINGTVDDLSLDQLEISTLDQTSIQLTGRVKHVRDQKLLFADVQLQKFASGKKDVEHLINPALLPKNITIPADIQVKGNFKGYVKNFDGKAAITTSLGNLIANIKMNPSAGNKEQAYEGNVSVQQFDLGKLLNNPEMLGPLSMHTTFKGQGLSDSTVHAQLNTTIEEAVFKKYEYKNLVIAGVIDKKSFDGTATIDDKNLAFKYKGIIDVDSAHPQFDFSFQLLGADLKALNLSEEDLRISLFIQSDLKKENTENMTGTAVLKNVLLLKGEEKFPVDSILLTSAYKDGQADISLTSDMLNADLNGDVTLSQLPAALTKHFKNYFDLQQPDTLHKPAVQKFKFEINVTDPTLLTEGIIPELEKLTPFSVNGNFDSEARSMNVDLKLSQLIYSKIIVDSLTVGIHSNTERLNYGVKVAEVSNPTVKMENINLSGDVKNNLIQFQLNTLKDDSTKMLSIGGNLKSVVDQFNLKLDPLLVLNNSNWSIDSSNYLLFGKKGMIANNVVLTSDKQSIAINSAEKTEHAPLEIKFSSFELETLSKIIENKKELAKGTLNGMVELKKENNAPSFTSDLDIKNLSFNGIPTGDIQLVADNKEHPKKYTVKLKLAGNDNDIQMNGFYNAEGPEPDLNFLLDIQRLNIATVEPYTFGQVTQMSGGLSGKINITGTTASPNVQGAIDFNTCAFKPRIVDSYLHVENGKLLLESKKIRFNSFTLIDSLNNQAKINGYVDIENLKSILFDLQVTSANFLALHTTEEDNPLYFGTIYLDSDIKLKGTTDHPVINAKIGLNKGTMITYVKPENISGKDDNKGIVEFIDTIQTQQAIMTRKKADTQVSATKGIDLHAIIDFDKDAELKMLVDRVAGDSLYVKGSGKLEFDMDESGKTNLVGKYRINDGGYHLTINDFIKKNFSIAKGSSVTWSGDVTDPYVDIKAVYKIKASPVDLVEDQLTGADQLERNKYRTLMTFLVDLKMVGFVSTPQISFDIEQPANERGALNGAVNAKLSQLRGDESQLNKQVFALLTLNRFISEDPLESNGAGGLSSTSRASASRILTQQLSNLSEKYVKGVDLNLGVNSYEDYSSGQEEGRTQLQLGVSKTLLNDKVTVQVGGNVDIEGEKAKQNNASDVAGNISIEYKLTDDGRYKLKGFRENEYENPIEGELTKTGFGIIYRRNYNKLKELFSKPQQKKKVTE
jgi:translocation and assembly module TamB